MQVERIREIWPNLAVETITNEFGTAIKLSGKGAKVVANYIARENYYDGVVDTLWHDVRHGLGYTVPLYNNPLNGEMMQENLNWHRVDAMYLPNLKK